VNETFFFYGTLRDPELLAIVLGRSPGALTEARLPGYRAVWAEGEAFPLIVEDPSSTAPGVLCEVSDEERRRLNFYEGGFDYAPTPTQVVRDGANVDALVFFPAPGLWTPGSAFSLTDWQARWGAMSRHAAREAMSAYPQTPAATIAARFPQIRARAQARVNAENVPATNPEGTPPLAGLQIADRRAPYDGFFRVEELDLRFPRFAAGLSPLVTRAVFVMADAVTVLPYDPIRDRVLLIQQFRVGPFARGDRAPWMLEPIAGRIDAGETPEATARREAAEEAGLTLGTLHKIPESYPSPGAVSEYLYSFVAEADLPDGIAGISGLASEAEDIRGSLHAFDAVLEMADSGQLRATPLLMSVYWLARHRDRLRAPTPRPKD
jgi:nudix-type nucleoside diphosphatase (YffH/AdpP family)